MNNGWLVYKLGDICEFENGDRGANYPSKSIRTIEGIPFINAGHLTDSGIDLTNMDYIPRERYDLLSNGKIKKGDILFCLRGSLGKFADVGELEEGAIASSLVILRPKKQVLNRFIQAYLSSKLCSDSIKKYSNGAAQPNLAATSLKQFLVPIPPLEEQQQIVAILDEAFTAIDQAKANIEHNLQNAKELFQSELNAVFSNKASNWEQKTLSEIATEFGRGKSKHRPRNDEKLFGGDHPFVQTGDVRNATKFIKNYTQTYNEVGLSQSKLWPIDTICITIAANIAESAILSFDSCFPDSIIGLIVNSNKANTEYTYYLLQYFKEELQKLGKGSAQDNINLSTFEHQKFPFPPLVEQRAIVSKLNRIADATNKLTVIYKQKIQAVENLKNSILQKAFTGELKTLEEVVL